MEEDELVAHFQDRIFNFRKYFFLIFVGNTMHIRLSERASLPKISWSTSISARTMPVHFPMKSSQSALGDHISRWSQCPSAPSPPVEDMNHQLYGLIWTLFFISWQKKKQNKTDVHILRDGPATLCKNHSNFYMISIQPHRRGFSKVSWNIFEESHQKLCTTDTLVCQGKDIPDEFFPSFWMIQAKGNSIIWVSWKLRRRMKVLDKCLNQY